jgi:hypothetical protein
LDTFGVVLVGLIAAAPYVLLIAAYFWRLWFVERIKRGVQHQFDEKIEDLRSTLRRSEEQFKARLQSKGTEISSLRAWVLSGAANRQALLDKRRFDAVERVWVTIIDMAPLKHLAAMMMHIDFKEAAKHAGKPELQKFLETFGSEIADPSKLKPNTARNERPYLTEPAWAYFSAYKAILLGSVSRYMALKVGGPGIDKYMTNEPTKKILKAALPTATQFIDEEEPEFYYLLLDEIEAALLSELRRVLDGKDVDHEGVVRARAIMDALPKSDEFPNAT